MIMKIKRTQQFLLIGSTVVSLFASGSASAGEPAPAPIIESRGSVDLWEPMLHKGTQELSLSGEMDWDGFDDLDYFVRASYGWFVADGFEFGLTGSLSDQQDSRQFSFGLFSDYNFFRKGKLVPYVGASVEWANADLDIRDLTVNQDAVLLGAELGVKYFIRENIAISLATVYEWASDEVFDSVDSFEDNRQVIRLGMRFYF